MIVACISLHLKQQDFCCFFLGTLLHSINYIVFIFSNLLQHLYILCLAGFNILISMFPFPLSSLSPYILDISDKIPGLDFNLLEKNSCSSKTKLLLSTNKQQSYLLFLKMNSEKPLNTHSTHIHTHFEIDLEKIKASPKLTLKLQHRDEIKHQTDNLHINSKPSTTSYWENHLKNSNLRAWLGRPT